MSSKTQRALKKTLEDLWFPELAPMKKAGFEPGDEELAAEAALDVDKKVRPLIIALVDAGYATSYSCQGGSGHESPVGLIGLDGDFISGPSDLKTIREIVREVTDVPFQIRGTEGSMFGKYCIIFRRPL